jgi:glyoxylase-like metal-dependent hydrolase (beta-lactamase superfamily II)
VAYAIEPVRIAPDVYAFFGARGEISAENGGRVGNSGFIVTRNSVVVVNTGGSYAHAREMIAAIRRITPNRIRFAIITTPFQEFLFGASAFRDIGATVLSHSETAKLIRQRCEECLARTRRHAGEGPFTGTRIIIPEEQIERSARFDVDGRVIDLYHFSWGATPGDLVVLDRGSGTAFTGALLSVGRVPDTHDWNFTSGWHSALDQLRLLSARTLVPGYGPLGSESSIDAVQTYLRELSLAVRREFDAGASLSEAVERVHIPLAAGWDMYGITHRQNTHRLYLRIEQGELQR